MDTLTIRILDHLVDDEEALEEVYLGVNFRREDDVFTQYTTHFRLTEILERLSELTERRWVEVTSWDKAFAGKHAVYDVYRMCEKGRKAWTACGEHVLAKAYATRTHPGA